MDIQRCQTPEDVTSAVSDIIADRLGQALVSRGTAGLALSGGSTPVPMYRRLATTDLDWRRIHVMQVDERVAPDGDDARNWSLINADLVQPTGAVGHPMPVTGPLDEGSMRDYAALVEEFGLDVVHLGIGADGHTASLVPSDDVLEATAEVALTAEYQGNRRMTLTPKGINRAHTIVWQINGGQKSSATAALLAHHVGPEPGIPARLVRREPRVVVVADAAALAETDAGADVEAGVKPRVEPDA